MSTEIYIIRHGESKANERDMFLGQKNMDLTARGESQARITADFLRGIDVDAIYSSDLLRAYFTAKATADILGIDIIKKTGMREIDAGEWDFMTFDDIAVKYPESWECWTNDFGNAVCDGGESVAHLRERVVNTVTEIAKENDGKTVFIFTHATPIRVLASYCLGKSIDEMKEVPWPSNASVSHVSWDAERLSLVEYSRDDFMGELATKLPDNV